MCHGRSNIAAQTPLWEQGVVLVEVAAVEQAAAAAVWIVVGFVVAVGADFVCLKRCQYA